MKKIWSNYYKIKYKFLIKVNYNLLLNLFITFIPIVSKLIKYWWQLHEIQFTIQFNNSLQKNLSRYENKYLHIYIRNSTNSYACDKPNEKFYF